MSRFDDIDDPRRRLLIQALAAGAFTTLLPAQDVFSASIFGKSPGKLPPGQSIFRLDGTVTVNNEPANLKTQIGPSDTIKTGDNSEAVFVVGGNSMLLRANSELTLTPKKKEEATETSLIAGLRLLFGKFLSVSRSDGMIVHTPTATLGIRGTGIYLESDPEQTYFCTCYGKADVSANNDKESTDSVISLHHDKPLYILANEQPGKNIRRAGFKNHTDQELMLIETLVGRTTPFAFTGGQYEAPRREY